MISEPHTTSDWRVGRRLRAWELYIQGWKQKDIAAALGVSTTAVNRWVKQSRQNGVEILRRQRPYGKPPRLAAEHLVELQRLLALGPEAFGFVEPVWTSKRVTAVIERWFGVKYHRGHVSKLLRHLGIMVRVPPVWTAKRDERVIAAWWDDRWTALQHMLPRCVVSTDDDDCGMPA